MNEDTLSPEAEQKRIADLEKRLHEHMTPPTGTQKVEDHPEEVTPPPRKKIRVNAESISFPVATVITLLALVAGGAVVWGQSKANAEETAKKADAAVAALQVKADKAEVDAAIAKAQTVDERTDIRLRVVEQASAANTSEHAALQRDMDKVQVQLASTNQKLDALLIRLGIPQPAAAKASP